MKIAYITHTTYVNGWANSVQIVNMCRAFSQQGADITLVLPYRSIQSRVDLFEYFDIPRTFKIKVLPCIDLSIGAEHVVFYWLRLISFYISARFYVWLNTFDVLYSRDLFSTLFFPDIVVEQHSFPKKINFLLDIALNKKRKVVCLTSFIRERFIKFGILEKNTLVAHSAVDLEEFSQERSKLNIDGIKEEDFVFGYIGTLKTMNMEKGLADGLAALNFLDTRYKFLVVGGENDDLHYYKKMAADLGVSERVIFIGKVPYGEVSVYTSKCDVFVAPFPENEHYSFFMSPLKIFEYMASKKPIVSTTLPSIKEVLKHEYNALLIPPSNPEALAKAIERLSNDPALSQRISSQAYKDVAERYTWNMRAKSIIDFIKS